jgi:hypothetical protein
MLWLSRTKKLPNFPLAKNFFSASFAIFHCTTVAQAFKIIVILKACATVVQ